jgi:negative regulator of sigma-B (phosphoserine phosphatase)
MTMAVSASTVFTLEAGVRVRPIGGETVAGDAAIIVPTKNKKTLAAMVDGLGHGARAAEAAQACIGFVEKNGDMPMAELFSHLHRELLKTRGAVASIARITPGDAKVEFAGVGNITAVLFRPKAASVRHVHPLTVPGVLGSAFRSVRVQDFPFNLGDMMIMHSDGIRPSFDLSRLAPMTAQEAADDIMKAHAKSTDDAGVDVVRGINGKTKPSAPPPAQPATATMPEERIPVRGPGDAECLAVATRGYTEKLGLDPKSRWGCSIAASELATNVLKFAGRGTAVLSLVTEPRRAFKLEVVDEGVGIPNLSAAMEDGFSEGAKLTADRPRHAGQGLGVGLGSVQRLMDSVEVYTQEGRGTRVVALKYLR